MKKNIRYMFLIVSILGIIVIWWLLFYDYSLDQAEQAELPVFSRVVQIHDYNAIYATLDIQRSLVIDTRFPDRFMPDPTQSNHDLSYRLSILPFTWDRHHDTYIVVPSIGAVAPIHTITGDVYNDLFAGNENSTLKLLEQWVVRHPHTYAPREWTGNMVIAGHTSYYNNNRGRYKTFFQFIPLLQEDDKILVFQRSGDDIQTYEFYVQSSYLTNPEDTAILTQNTANKRITLYGCYPFGTIEDRWVVTAEMLY